MSKRRKVTAQEVLTIADSDDDDSLPDAVFSSAPTIKNAAATSAQRPGFSQQTGIFGQTGIGVGSGTEQLNNKQDHALMLVKRSSNVFITGVAGTGKSFVLSRVIRYLRETYERDEWVAVGPTGPTAIAIGGQTIHSFAGIGVPKTVEDFEKAWGKKEEWRKLRAMVIDEVSMISGEFFDCLSGVVSVIRGDPRPFGGIHLIVCGDFLQLPPIPPRRSDVQEMKTALNQRANNTKLFLNRGFTFQARGWKVAGFTVVQLDEVFRQKNSDFVHVLQEIRTGRVSPASVTFLESCNRPLPPNSHGILPTVLHAKNKDVASENLLELDKLPGDTHTFEAINSVELEEDAPSWAESNLLTNQFFDNCIAERILKLKIGAQVMLVKNEIPVQGSKKPRLVNGSRGVVIGFKANKEVGGEDSDEDSDDDDVDSRVAEEVGLPGVALYPVVQFVNGSKKLITPKRFESRLVGLGSCIRVAVPLKLAWAITTHKSQGLTLDYVIADVGGVFTEAQTYVALSRASDENGLEVRNFSETKVRANHHALSFYSNPNGSFEHWDHEQQHAAARKAIVIPEGKPGCLQGKAFVFSGVLNSLSREEAEQLVKKYGGVVRSAVSGKTNFLVIGDNMEDGRPTTAGTKYGKAVQIRDSGKNKSDLQIVDEEGLFLEIRKG